MNNIEFSEKIIKKYDPSFKHRWDIYNEMVKNSLGEEKIWIDCGCGNNGMIQVYGKFVKTAIGVDIIDTSNKKNFIKADIDNLPFSSNFADLITLRFVVEHFRDQNKYFSELSRILKRGGKIIILTTNLYSPLIFLPKMLPNSLKSRILTKLFKVQDKEVFPAYHKFNTPQKYKEFRENYTIEKIIFISDLNYNRKWIFILLFIWHKLTSLKTLNKFRTNILVVLKKI